MGRGNLLGRGAKRFLDVLASSLAILLLSPLLFALAILVAAKMGRPVLFRQQRPGLHGEPFMFYKFRTMTDQRDDKGQLLTDERRITRFGALLRRTTLDELPALLNVLKGDMSLVGPRPLLMRYLPLYGKEQARRHDVKPGLTGWAVVNGRNRLSWEEKFRLDIWYVDNQSFWLDVKILFKTVALIFRRSGVSAEGHATMPEFTGSDRK